MFVEYKDTVMMEELFAIQITNLEKTYATGARALKSVSLSVKAGEIFGLLGSNGAGKTTLIGIVCGLVNKTGGKVQVFGVDIDENPDLAKSFIGIVPQEVNFNIFDSPFEIVVNQAGYYGIPRSVAIPRAHHLLEVMGLKEKAFVKTMTLSGGMKRRLLIARALVHQPKILLLDEPTAGVDVELRRSMWEYIKAIVAKGTTIILTTHYLEEAERYCDRAAIINKGEIILEGSMKDILGQSESGKLEDLFFKLTKSTQLLGEE